MQQFHPDIPRYPKCPPDGAEVPSGKIWRGVKQLPLSEEHFKSHAELELPNCDREDCTHWGLSVWVSEDAVHHARQLHKYMRRWHIAAGKIDAKDGVIMRTSSQSQPDHYTFWKFYKHSVLPKFEIVMNPVKA